MKKLLSILLAALMALAVTACGNEPADVPAEKTDFETIAESGKLKIGFTYYEPMNYIDTDGNFVGFETEFAAAVAGKLGLEPEFVEIEWAAKLMDLKSRNIDCIWNGMTVTDEVTSAADVSASYLKNFQVVVIRADKLDTYKTTADLADKTVEAEAGSAGEAAIAAEENLSKANYVSVTKQTDALPEVLTGACDAAVLDYVLANALVGKGDFKDLAVIPDLQLSVEEYAAAFRKDSDLTAKVNEAMDAMIQDGSLAALAEKYGLSAQLIANQ